MQTTMDLNLLLKSLGDLVLLVNSDLVFCAYWAIDESLFFSNPSKFLNKKVDVALDNDFGKIASANIANVFKTGITEEIVYPSVYQNNWFKAKISLVLTPEEVETRHVVIIISEYTAEVALDAEKRILENIILQNWDAIIYTNLDGLIQYANPAANRLYGYKETELLGESVEVLSVGKSGGSDKVVETIVDTGMWSGEIKQIKKDGSTLETFLYVQLITDKNGKPVGYSTQSKDISNEKETESKLKEIIVEKEALLKEVGVFANIVSQNWDAIVFANLEGVIEYHNPAANRLYGYSGEELIGQNVDVLNSQKSHDTGEIVETIIATGKWSGEIKQIKKDGTLIDAYLSVQLIKDSSGAPIGYASHSKDISNEKETALKLKQIINERETLLKEIHHRVKNNLQVITSLLSLQSHTIDDVTTKNLFQQSQYRINAMATIHETLYQTDDFLTIGYDRYLKALGHYLIVSMKGVDNKVTFRVDAEEVKLNIDTAIPLGLLINEIITNALKYGIEGDSTGEIYIKLKALKAPSYILEIGDNGKGFLEDISFANTRSLGMKLIQSLTRQLRGRIEKDKDRKGTHYTLHFQEID